VRNQLSSVYRKLNVKNKTSLARVLELGEVDGQERENEHLRISRQ